MKATNVRWSPSLCIITSLVLASLLCPQSLLAEAAPAFSAGTPSGASKNKVPLEIPNAVHYPIYIPTNQGGVPGLFGPSSFAPGAPHYPLMSDNSAWMGAMSASEGLADWSSSPLVEIYDEQQLTKQKDRIRQRMELIRSRQNKLRQQASGTSSRLQRPSDSDPFDSYNNEQQQQTSASNVRGRKALPSAYRKKWQLEQDNGQAGLDKFGSW